MTVPPICVVCILHIQSGYYCVHSFKLSTDRGMLILHHQLLCLLGFEIKSRDGTHGSYWMLGQWLWRKMS